MLEGHSGIRPLLWSCTQFDILWAMLLQLFVDGCIDNLICLDRWISIRLNTFEYQCVQKNIYKIPTDQFLIACNASSLWLFSPKCYRNGNVGILPQLSSLVALQDIKMTTYDANVDENLWKRKHLLFCLFNDVICPKVSPDIHPTEFSNANPHCGPCWYIVEALFANVIGL